MSKHEIEKKVEMLFDVMVKSYADKMRERFLISRTSILANAGRALVTCGNLEKLIVENNDMAEGEEPGEGADCSIDFSLGQQSAKAKSKKLLIATGLEFDAFKEIFNSFPLRMQEIVLSYYIENKSVKEIAEEIGCSISTTRVDLHKGRHRLGEV